MTPQEITSILAVLKGTYNHRFEVTKATEASWNMIVGDLDFHAVNTAIANWMMSGEGWPPVPTEVRKIVLDTSGALPSPETAWLMVQERIRNTYPGHPVDKWEVPDAVSKAVNDVGGIRAIRMTEKPEDMERRFRKAYDARRQARQVTLSLEESGRKELT